MSAKKSFATLRPVLRSISATEGGSSNSGLHSRSLLCESTQSRVGRVCSLCSTSLILLLIILISSVTAASITVYTDRSAWESAVNYDFGEEFFTDTILNQGVSVVTTNGYIDVDAGLWGDQVIPNEATTTWIFADAIIGYGGNWDLAGPGGPGTDIQLFLDGMPVSNEIPGSFAGDFFGVVSTVPFNQVLITAGSNTGGWCERYTMDNMVYAVSPRCKLELTKVDDINDCVGPGHEITYTIRYIYHGDMNCPDINDVNIIDFLPAELEYASSEPVPNDILDCNTIIWEIGTLKPEDTNCIKLKVKVRCLKPEPGSKIKNKCELRSGDMVLYLAYKYTPICANYLVVDDFESYNNTNNKIYNTWKAVGGAKVGYSDPNYAEVTIVHGGKQSMPFDYNNTKPPYYSEAYRTFDMQQDWTRLGVKALSLWLRGYMAPVGSFVEDPAGIYTMTASGTDINVPDWRHPSKFRDEFHYAWIPVNSTDCTITAKVNSISNTDAFAKAAVMIRNSLADNPAYAMVYITPSNGVRFQYRANAGSRSDYNGNDPNIGTPHWIRLERHWVDPLVFYNAYYSPDDVNWLPLGGTDSLNLEMAGTDYIGLAMTAHNATATCTSVFSNVTILIDGQPVTLPSPWTSHADIGIKSNTAAPLYVALQDSNNITATVSHPDPNIALAYPWQEWLIPLASFADANLAAIKKITIGVGDRISYHGLGTLYLDDIRLYPCVPDIGPLGDFTCDCMVNFRDFALLANEWFDTGCPATDLYVDHKIDLEDLAILAENWLMEQLQP